MNVHEDWHVCWHSVDAFQLATRIHRLHCEHSQPMMLRISIWKLVDCHGLKMHSRMNRFVLVVTWNQTIMDAFQLTTRSNRFYRKRILNHGYGRDSRRRFERPLVENDRNRIDSFWSRGRRHPVLTQILMMTRNWISIIFLFFMNVQMLLLIWMEILMFNLCWL